MPQLNWKIDFGHILTILSLIGGLLIGAAQVSGRFAVVEANQKNMSDNLSMIHADHVQLSTTLEEVRLKQREIDTRLINVEKRIEEHMSGRRSSRSNGLILAFR